MKIPIRDHECNQFLHNKVALPSHPNICFPASCGIPVHGSNGLRKKHYNLQELHLATEEEFEMKTVPTTLKSVYIWTEFHLHAALYQLITLTIRYI